MANAAKIAKLDPIRMMIVGYPGSAKTGSIAALLNAGYKVRMLDYDGNAKPLLVYTDPDKLANLDIVSLKDPLRSGSSYIEPVGIPTAFKRGLDLMDKWEYTDEDGEVVNLGASKDWGCDTVVVLDGLTSMGKAAFRRVQKLMNKTPVNTTQAVWGTAMAEQEAFLEKLVSPLNKFHVIVLSHLVMIGPKITMKGDDALTQQVKTDVADLVDTRLFPSALGQALPPKIGGLFPTIVLAEAQYKGRVASRKLITMTRPELDLKVPARNIEPALDISTGLLQIFEAVTPGVTASCVKKGDSPPSVATEGTDNGK